MVGTSLNCKFAYARILMLFSYVWFKKIKKHNIMVSNSNVVSLVDIKADNKRD